jgi:predicted adenine nucleotide alpha hydrolase (AANH) superfamily ATPase
MNQTASNPSLLVHACCAPCSTVPLARLRDRFRLSIFFYGPNIHPAEEYGRRLSEQRRLCDLEGVELIEGTYEPQVWEERVGPFADQPESSHGQRCQRCYLLRMEATADLAARRAMDLFTVTLSVSRHKSSKLLAQLGEQVAAQRRQTESSGAAGPGYLAEDFGKQDGFGLSVRRSRELNLYRQDHCGCRLSLEEAARRRVRREASVR